MNLRSKSVFSRIFVLAILALLWVPSAYAISISPAPTPEPEPTVSCDVDVQPVELRAGVPALTVDFGMKSGDFRCAAGGCTGSLREVGTDREVQINLHRCEIGDQCLVTEASSGKGNQVTLIHNYSQAGRNGIFQQEIHVNGTSGSATLYSLRLTNARGQVLSASYNVDGRTVTPEEFAATGRQVAGWAPEVGLAYTITKRMADDVGFVIPPVIEESFLDCIKSCVTDCGGTHNGGNCKTFRWSDGGSTGTFLCVELCAAGCGIAHPWGSIGCCIAGL
jgi:hypothetical protein